MLAYGTHTSHTTFNIPSKMQKLKAKLHRRTSSQDPRTAPANDTPENNAIRGVKAFCESAGVGNSEDEVLHLPIIVDAAESSPAAAKAAAAQIRTCLSKENYSRPHVQYNAVMLVRILSDNPGKTFTRCLDVKFATTVKELLRTSQDPSVQQLVRETLENFEGQKKDDEGLGPLREMWTKEKAKPSRMQSNGTPAQSTPYARQQQDQHNYFARSHRARNTLPSPPELAARIEEAKTSAKLLLQVVQSTPPTEIINNDLITEFSQRCQSASRSVQGYIQADSPPPDDDTLLTLIETNDQLSLAMSRHQRAVLQARKSLSSQNASPSPSTGAGGVTSPPAAPPTRAEPQNPFADSAQQPPPQNLQAPLNPAPPSQSYAQPQPQTRSYSQPRSQPHYPPSNPTHHDMPPHSPQEEMYESDYRIPARPAPGSAPGPGQRQDARVEDNQYRHLIPNHPAANAESPSDYAPTPQNTYPPPNAYPTPPQQTGHLSQTSSSEQPYQTHATNYPPPTDYPPPSGYGQDPTMLSGNQANFAGTNGGGAMERNSYVSPISPVDRQGGRDGPGQGQGFGGRSYGY
ncbi:MAG: hypothetical protein M1817_000997 [Caeruleum heppii]|nr:MAG: hypothetical protein M1817_000997 [Caeruleum heppii]